jgi:enoyl reductase-like protein
MVKVAPIETLSAEAISDMIRAALGDTADLTIEEWIERFVDLPPLTITQVILSREIAALTDTFREPLGKRLSIRARRRWHGRARAWLRRTA